MNTKELRYFQRIFEEKSINKAAGQLFITPQGLSKIIQNLEEELGTKLFERTKTGMVPTECGIYLYKNCNGLLDKFTEIITGLQRIKENDNKIRIGFSCGVLNVVPFHKLNELKSICGDVPIQWDEGSNEEVIKSVLCGESDFGFVIGQITEQNIWSKELYSKRMDAIVYQGHPFYERTSLSVGELKDESFITLNEKFYCYHSFVQRCQDFGFTPNILIKTMESQLIYRFCRQKLGLGIDVDIHREDVSLEYVRRIELHDSIPWKISVIAKRDNRNEKIVQGIENIFFDLKK